MRNTKKSLLHLLLLLPKEVIEEIFSRLPVKSLMRFRCVSKSWLSLIGSDRFIKMHLKNSTKNMSHRVVYNDESGVISGCSLQSFLNSNSEEESSLISNDLTNYLPKIEFILGSCNGVLCLSSPYAENGRFSLWNPATRVFMELPKLETNFHKFGFGWDESSGAFKVFATLVIENPNTKILGQVYSSKTNSWKTVPLGSRALFSVVGVFVDGRIYWAKGIDSDHEHVIESFDLESDEFGRIELPPFNANANGIACRPWTSLGVIGGCLCTLFHYDKSIDFWVMKEYGVKESWFKLLTFPLAVFMSPVSAFPPQIGEGPDGEIFIIYIDTLMLYSPKDDAFSTTKDGSFSRAHIYVESLVSPLTNAV